jgi:hypothetical protein
MQNSDSISELSMLKPVRLRLIFLAVFLMTTFTACFGSGGDKVVTRYYLINPIDTGPLDGTLDRSLVIEIIDGHLPQYQDRFHIATRLGIIV